MRETAQQAADRIREERRAAGTLGRPAARATQVLDRMRSAVATTVTVIDAVDDAEALDVALRAAGETRDSLYGWDVGAPDDAGVRTIRLHTS